MLIHYPFRRLLFVGVFSTLIFSCNHQPEVIPADRMSTIITELQIAESYAQHVPKDSTSHSPTNQDSLKKYTASILLENKITESEFKQSMNWYKTQPEMLDSIYQQVLSNIALWQAKQSIKK